MLVLGEKVHTQNTGFSSLLDSLNLCVKYDVDVLSCMHIQQVK